MARGSIQKRIGPQGRVSWTAIVDLPKVLDPKTGKLVRKQKRVTAATKKEVEAMAAALVAATEKGMPDTTRATVAEFMAYWLGTLGGAVKPGTLRAYRDMTRNHVVPYLGPVRLAKLTPAHLHQLYAGRTAAGLSNTTVNMLHHMLHRAIGDAVRWEYVHRNVADAAKPPRRDRPELTVWSIAEVERFLTAAHDASDPLAALWALALDTGMRRGELLGLKWADVDLEAGALSISRTLSRGEGSALVEQRPKTKGSARRIALSPAAVAVLRAHRKAQAEYRLSIGPVWEPHDYVFTNEIGGSIHPNTLARLFTAAMTRADVPRIRFHDLRHTAATVLMERGVHPKVVSERLGHSTISMTLDRYGHVTQDMQQSAADAMETVHPRPKSERA